MSLRLDSEEAERLLMTLVKRTGEAPIEAATRAFRERLERLNVQQATTQSRGAISLADLIADARASTTLDERDLSTMADELWEDT